MLFIEDTIMEAAQTEGESTDANQTEVLLLANTEPEEQEDQLPDSVLNFHQGKRNSGSLRETS